MTIRRLCIGAVFCLIFFNGFGSAWYVHPSGSNNLTGDNGRSVEHPLQSIAYAFNTAANPGDTIFVLEGIYYNNNYGNGEINNPPVAYLSNSGAPDQWIVLRNYPGDTVKIKFDGSGAFIANAINYVEISGFTIEGPNQDISLDSALAHRLTDPKPSYYNGRGIAIWGEAYHIKITHNTIFNCPASGIRVNKGDYITVSHNKVYNNTWYTSSAESAIVFAESMSIDTKDSIKMVMSHNLVYNNYNQIPFYTKNPPDVGIENYGTEEQDYIIDGSGVYITRNKTYEYGWYYLANNIAYHNGINGVVVHRTDRAIVANNTAFMNGKVPLSMGRQNSSGITFNEADQVRVYNNIAWARYDTDYALKQYGTVSIVDMDANIVAHGLSDYTEGVIFADPLFADTANFDLSLTQGSPAINAGVFNAYTPSDDYTGVLRGEDPDIGALEFLVASTNKNTLALQEDIRIAPNPFQDYFIIYFDSPGEKTITLFSFTGIKLLHNRTTSDNIRIDTEALNSGMYLLKVDFSGTGRSEIIKILRSK